MPHHSIHYTSAGQEALYRINKGRLEFRNDLQGVTAKVFNELLGESLVPGQTVVTDAIVRATGMPVDFHLTCTAWATTERFAKASLLEVRFREEIASYIEDAFAGQLPTWDAHLNLVGLPA